MSDNDINAIDRKINQSAIDNVKGVKDYLKNKSLSNSFMQEYINDMIDGFSKRDLAKVLKLVLDIEEKNIDVE
tara:strand:+ start:628 stop:846 length:219 start_codon:yes stop_codon:yes gene_type:complete